MLSKEQVSGIKQQLIQQIEKTLIGRDLESSKKHIESMSPNELEEFLKKNNLVKEGGEKCIFCSIIFGDISSYKIDETEDAIAVLEINPISKGHIMIIPREHTEKLTEDIQEFAKKVARNIEKKLSPKKTIISDQILFGHKVMVIVPVYTNETLNSKKQPAEASELEKMQKILAEKPEVKREKKVVKKRITEKNTWLPRRIP